MENKYFKLEDSIFHITEKYPFTIDLFASIGFENIKDDSVRRSLGKSITLKQALSLKKINEESFSERLVNEIDSNINNADYSLGNNNKNEKANIKIQGLLPCPVRIPLMEEFNKFLEESCDIDKESIDVNLQAASMGIDFIKEKAEKAETEDDLADIFISAGFDFFFDKNLMGKFKKQKVFKDITGFKSLNMDLDNNDISLKDPDGEYSMIGVVPAVFLINKEELNGRQMPVSYKDILNEEFENSVSLPIGDFDLFNAILLNIYKNYGEEGVRRLKKSLFKGMHPSQMVKSNIKKGAKPVVSIMPYFFTKMIKMDGPMTAVWPEDGAIISPIFMLSKRSKEKSLKSIIDFLSSKAVGEILAHNGRFPSVNPEVDNMLSPEQKFMWLGWDYIKNNDIGALIINCENIFNRE
ncbi:MAG: ABC transporter substrate-binding protein [Bacillota bacterium]|nr:ABC transporter substrate-binding protein [Bacillota bacterium]